MIRALLFFVFLFFSSCSPHSLEDFQHEGEAHLRILCRELNKIDSREVLAQAEPRLKKIFNRLVDLMIEARKYQREHPEEQISEGALCDHFLNEALMLELKRVYQLEGAREIVESAQKEALIRLDAFERALAKEKSRIPQSA